MDDDFKFQLACQFLFSLKVKTEAGEVKPVYLHSLLVALRLRSTGSDLETYIAGLLHDSIEDFEVTPAKIEKIFGKNIRTLVEANTKNNDLEEPEKGEELLTRIIATGKDAIAIKAADIIENLLYFTKAKNQAAVTKLTKYAKYLDANNPYKVKE